MKGLITLSFRNVLRHKKRSLLTILSVTIGIFALVMSSTMINGIDETTIRNYRKTMTAPVKIFNTDYFNERNNLPLENLISDPDQIITTLKSKINHVEITKRLNFRGRIIVDINEVICNVIGIDPASDNRVFNLKNDILDENKGTVYDNFSNGENQCLIGHDLARIIDGAIGDEIIVYTRTVNNAHNAVSYYIAGILNTGNPEIDSFSVVLKFADASILADSSGYASEIDLSLNGNYKINSELLKNDVIHNINGTVSAYTWKEQLKELLTFFAMRKVAQKLIIVFLLILAVTGVTNTMLMAVFERTKEISTLSAIGMKNHRIIEMFIYEGIIIGITGALFAFIISTPPILYICIQGISLVNSDLTQNMPSKIYGYFDFSYYFYAVIAAVFAAVTGTLYPALRAVRLNIAQVLRSK
ncbi:MAG: hypothetical protein A2015_15300 [Spirochaetes bacterium GWF1_31_7]|nr:MAG: hypothetical protein A2Y30_11720 [Spirochaetes bacterium GWE1_32_154]OHD51186.1 MAG: hypothetical protein A2Y29_01260 [Spirochaetes bacterium GWE2_31_10]OHD52105.1 MAG: hypothetical protein A2015_15300 [Spirochaetes bacterium GWF1_31_7]HBD93280.1 hypothetical protein [Spirochaetia bacterium]